MPKDMAEENMVEAHRQRFPFHPRIKERGELRPPERKQWRDTGPE